jgi:hypothetical protein
MCILKCSEPRLLKDKNLIQSCLHVSATQTPIYSYTQTGAQHIILKIIFVEIKIKTWTISSWRTSKGRCPKAAQTQAYVREAHTRGTYSIYTHTTHTHTHTHHAHAHAHTHVHAHAHAHTYTHVHAHAHTHAGERRSTQTDRQTDRQTDSETKSSTNPSARRPSVKPQQNFESKRYEGKFGDQGVNVVMLVRAFQESKKNATRAAFADRNALQQPKALP